MLDFVAARIAEIRAADGCPDSEIAVLYAMQQPKGFRNDLPAAIRSALEARGILSHCVSQNHASKAAYDITTNSVAISTIHSVKGLDHAAVFVLGLDFLQPKGWTAIQIERLTYVAITRARYHLVIPYLKKTALVEKLIQANRAPSQ
jgi:superfamily I DNA and RNA helicase